MLLLKKLRESAGAYDKRRLLETAHELEKMVFNYALDPYKVYHINSFPVVEIDEGEPDLEMFDLLDKLLEGELRGNAARDAVNAYAKNNGSLIKKICQKKLRCGCSAKTVNIAFPGLVPMFEVQLAKEVPLAQIKYPKLVQIKYDGVRIIAIKRGDNVKFRTRNGKEVNLPLFGELISKITGDFILDGEMTLASGKTDDRTTVSGMINSAMHGGNINQRKMVFNVFDAMTLKHWERTDCPVGYEDRLKLVNVLVDDINSSMVTVALTLHAKDRATLDYQYDKVIQQGYEGLILKDRNHLYTFKRSKDWIKLKEVKTADLVCIGYIEGEGKYEGQIGALTCKGEVEGKQIVVNIGSGLTDADRACPPEAYLDKTIEIKYNSTIQDSVSSEYSLFLPRFVMVRYDK
jgi:DNA ligase-1